MTGWTLYDAVVRTGLDVGAALIGLGTFGLITAWTIDRALHHWRKKRPPFKVEDDDRDLRVPLSRPGSYIRWKP